MGIKFVEVFSLFTQAPGNLIYHLAVSLVWLLILGVSAVNLSKNRHRQRAKHLLTGSVILLVLQFAMVFVDFILLPGSDDPSIFFLVGQQCAGALLILWLTWTFLQGRKPLQFTRMSIFISLALIFFLAESILLSFFRLAALQNLPDLLPILWDVFSMAIVLVGCVLSLATKPEQWELALAILLTLAAGYFLPRLFIYEPIDILGGVRIAHILSLPWSLILLQRLSGKTPEIEKIAERILPHTQKADPTPILVDELLRIALQESSSQRAKAAARALSYSVISDICYLAHIPEGRATVELIAGYDLIREEATPTASLPSDQFPRIMDAWGAQRRLALSGADSAIQDTSTLTHLLRYHRLGNLLAFPLSLPDRGLVGGVIFLSPYTEKIFGENVHLLMDKISPTLSRVLYEPVPYERIEAELASARDAVDDLLTEKKALTKAFTRLGTTIDTQEGTIRQLKARYQVDRLEAIKQYQAYQAQIDKLQSESAALKDHLAEREQLQEKIRQITSERDGLQVSLARLNARIKEFEQQTGQTGPIRLSMENQVLSLNSILANVKHAKAAQFHGNNLHLEIINPDGGQMIRTDPVLLESALEGLMDNAVKASPPGSKIHISQELSFETGMLILQITDFGQGLTPAEQRAFFSGEGTAPPGIGSLSSIREAIRAIRLLNGKIWIKSEKDHFTTFRVELPVRIID